MRSPVNTPTQCLCGSGLAGGIATTGIRRRSLCHGCGLYSDRFGQSVLRRSRYINALVKKMLAEARQADVIMAPAADMFEMGGQSSGAQTRNHVFHARP